MKQIQRDIILLEAKDLKRLQKGKIMTLTLSSGNSIELGLEMNGARNVSSNGGTKKGGKTQMVIDYFKNNGNKWTSRKDVAIAVGIDTDRVGLIFHNLDRYQDVMKKKNGMYHGRPRYAYKIADKRLNK